MTNTPKPVGEDEIWEIYCRNNCDSRLVDCEVLPIDVRRVTESETARTGVVAFRFEQRTSLDGTCIVQVDVFTFADNREEIFIVDLMIDGEEYWVQSNGPRPL